MLNKTISASKKFHLLSDDTCRLLATWIIPHLDKNGVYYGEPALVRSYIFPMRDDIDTDQVESYLQELEGVGLMARYAANGRTWQHWPGFDDNQVGLRKDREGTDFPDPPQDSQEIAGELPDDSRKDAGELPAEVKGKEVKLKSKGSKDPAPDGAPPPEPEHRTPTPPPDILTDYEMIRQAYIELFPDKPKPRASNKTLQGKVKTRTKSAHFQENWRLALERAATSKFIRAGPWFDLAWFLKNDDNYEKCLNGNYDDKGARNGKRSDSDKIVLQGGYVPYAADPAEFADVPG